jgi:hypothetical protein
MVEGTEHHHILCVTHTNKSLQHITSNYTLIHEICKWKANWIGHILRRNCILQRVIEGKVQGRIEVTERQGRRRRKLLDDLKERRILLFERGSSGSHYVESWLWNRL